MHTTHRQLLVLKYVQNKDVFMRYHKTHLTRRLILETSADSEKEENMVEWLRVGTLTTCLCYATVVNFPSLSSFLSLLSLFLSSLSLSPPSLPLFLSSLSLLPLFLSSLSLSLFLPLSLSLSLPSSLSLPYAPPPPSQDVGMPAEYVNKLARMFQDIKVSEDLNQEFKEKNRGSQVAGEGGREGGGEL